MTSKNGAENSEVDPLATTVRPLTTRLFANDLLDFRDIVTKWQRSLKDLSFAEGEGLNVAMIRINETENLEHRERVIKELELNEEQAKTFHMFCEWSMKRNLEVARQVTARRDALDKRKRRRGSDHAD